MFGYYLWLAGRSLRRNPVLTALMVAAIALGIGAAMTSLTVLRAMSGNPIFPAVVEGLLTWLGDHYTVLVRAPGAERATLQEHQRIIDAIAAGDADEAAAAMTDHLNRASDLYRHAAPVTQGGR